MVLIEDYMVIYCIFKSSNQCVGFDFDTNPNVPSRCWHHFDISNLANVDVGGAPGVSHYRKLSCTGQPGKYKETRKTLKSCSKNNFLSSGVTFSKSPSDGALLRFL